MNAAGFTEVALPGGVLDGDQRQQTVSLRPLTGREEELLASFGRDVPAAVRVTALLTRCLGPSGTDGPPIDVRRLTVGDREALLLHVRRLSLGDRIDCVARCPQEACGEPVDVELRVHDLLLPPYDQIAIWREETVEAGDDAFDLRFRLPTGGDQEAVASLAGSDVRAAVRVLMRRCVEPRDDDARDIEDLPDAIVTAVADRMAELDPQAELRLDMTCPSCGAAISTLFDTASFLFAEVGAGDRLLEEVHALAWYYHWPETDILALTATRRRRYLDLIASSLQRGRERGPA
jgi:hypothetical protein